MFVYIWLIGTFIRSRKETAESHLQHAKCQKWSLKVTNGTMSLVFVYPQKNPWSRSWFWSSSFDYSVAAWTISNYRQRWQSTSHVKVTQHYLSHIRVTLFTLQTPCSFKPLQLTGLMNWLGFSFLVFNAFVQVLKWPDYRDQQDIAQEFQLRFTIPDVVGVLDGTHIRLAGCPSGDSDYINRKSFASMQLQVWKTTHYQIFF